MSGEKKTIPHQIRGTLGSVKHIIRLIMVAPVPFTQKIIL